MKYQNMLIPKENIQIYLDSFVKENRYDNYMYELYIDKIDPHNYKLILYAGNKSLTQKENKDFDQSSLASVIISGVEIKIYSGIEHYFEASMKKDFPSIQTNDDEDGILWAIRDSFGILSSYKLNEAYPFLPFPLKIAPNVLVPPVISRK